MKGDAISLRRFEWLLTQRACTFEPEERVFSRIPNRGKQPDFFVTFPDGRGAVAEVESFEKPTILRTTTARVISVGHMSLQKRINRAVRHAAEQLAPYADLGIPLLVVLDNHRQVGLQLKRHELVSLFGEQRIVLTLDTATGKQIGEPVLQHEEDGSPFAGGARAFVSAVIVNEPVYRFDDFDKTDDFTQERPMRARIIHHPHAQTPLPLEVFAMDEQIVYRDERWNEAPRPDGRDEL